MNRFLIILLMLCSMLLVACHAKTKHTHYNVKTYTTVGDNNELLYWYIFMNNSTPSSNSVSYIKSSVPLDNFRNLTPVPATKQEVKEELEEKNAELENDAELELDSAPDLIVQEEHTLEQDVNTEPTETSSGETSGDSASTDTASDGGSSGGE